MSNNLFIPAFVTFYAFGYKNKHSFFILKVATKHLNVFFNYFQAPATWVSRPFKTRVSGSKNRQKPGFSDSGKPG